MNAPTTDPDHLAVWQPDTLVNVYSVGKAFVAPVLLQLVDEGHLELDDHVASVWPEFGSAGKENATIRQALCHPQLRLVRRAPDRAPKR